LNDIGIALDLQGRHAEAQAAYGRAIGIDPAMRAAQVNLALSTALNGQPDAAARMLLPVAGGPDATTRERHDLAAVLAMSGHANEARELLRPDLQGADLDAALAGYRALLATPQQGFPRASQGPGTAP
jgi:Flp pilus assembly protein TadD